MDKYNKGQFDISNKGICFYEYSKNKLELGIRDENLGRGNCDNLGNISEQLILNENIITLNNGFGSIIELSIKNLKSDVLYFIELFSSIKTLNLTSSHTYNFINNRTSIKCLQSLEYLNICDNRINNDKFFRSLVNLKCVFLSKYDYPNLKNIPLHWKIISENNNYIGLQKQMHPLEEKIIKTGKCNAYFNEKDCIEIINFFRDQGLTEKDMFGFRINENNIVENVKRHYKGCVLYPHNFKIFSEILCNKQNSWSFRNLIFPF